jgi:hypothetical protein
MALEEYGEMDLNVLERVTVINRLWTVIDEQFIGHWWDYQLLKNNSALSMKILNMIIMNYQYNAQTKKKKK